MGKSTKDKQDIFYRKAKEEGWRARSAFKLLQIHEQFNIFNGVTRAVDLCAAPGSWSQVLTKRLRAKSESLSDVPSDANNISTPRSADVKIVSVDIQTMAPIDGVTMIQGDITRSETADKIISEFQGCKAQLVVCDGAPDVTGQHDLDEFMQSQLLLAALNITTFIIEEGGTFVAKIFRGKDITLMVAQFRLFFERVHVVKPKSSRASSIEAFIYCHNFKLPPAYKPRMFDLLTDFNTLGANDECSQMMIPFLTCGDLNELQQSPIIREASTTLVAE